MSGSHLGRVLSSRDLLCCCFTSKVMSGRTVNLTTFSWEGLDLLSGWPVLRAHTFASNWQLPLLNQRKEKRKYVARPDIEPRTSDLWVRCPADCATRPGSHLGRALSSREGNWKSQELVPFYRKCKKRRCTHNLPKSFYSLCSSTLSRQCPHG